MSTKRQAPTELNHENWNDEDPVEEDQTGGFAIAPKEVLEKRVIRTAKRRSQAISGEAKKSVFSGFSGFNKIQHSSFDFLSNLTNGSKNNGSLTSTSETAVSSSSVNSNPSNTISSGIFSLSGTSTPTKAAFGKPPADSPFGGTSETTVTTSSLFSQSVFTTSKADSTVSDNPFKIQSTVTSPIAGDFGKKTNPASDKPLSQVSSTIFGTPSTSANSGNTLFSSTSNNFATFKKQTPQIFNKTSDAKKPESKPESKSSLMTYHNKLKGLNESVSDCIRKHVEEMPICILTPIFKDYEKYLKDIQEEYEKNKEQEKKDSAKSEPEPKQNTSPEKSVSVSKSTTSTLFSGNKSSIFAAVTSSPKTSNTTSVFNTGTSIASCTFSTTTTPSTGFSFGIKPNTNTSPLTSATTTNGNTPFSFGMGKPFSFSTNVNTPKPEEPANEANDNEDVPPKVEYTPIVEENSVYDKKCKIFVKKDGNFIDKGVGTLYIKKVEDSGKHQLLVRANTAIGNVLLNLILSSGVPTQRMGKNNVMMICIPTPDAKPPPTSVLVRVKTSEEADELLETLNKYKV
ncbi:nucleoporin [Danaus plexippus plexippus]|uniref:Nucleoporin n=1 Tax=Danaus plexippus plexippus TaxID=278856 RepID=A0A212ETT2_DANPL|nr:nucleoporin [Danaus plexippus plexippus]